MTTLKNQIWEWTKALVIALGLAFLIRYFLFAPILVEGVSMLPTLNDQDRMIVNKISYTLGDIDRFDIVVFKATENKDYIKRVIGLPGDSIEYKDDVLYVNGKTVDEPYLEPLKEQVTDGPLTYDFTLEQLTGKKTVPKGHVFVMGDNRRFSKDSRLIGFVDINDILGETNVVYWPIEDFRKAN